MKKMDDSLADNLPSGDTVVNTGTQKKSELAEEEKDRELHEEDHLVSVLWKDKDACIYAILSCF
jgi:hypothetical protein